MAIEWKKIAYVENSAAQSVLGNPTGSPAVASAITVAEQTLVGRITGGNVDDLSVTQVKTLLGNASEADVGLVELATNAETINIADTSRAVTPDDLGYFIKRIPSYLGIISTAAEESAPLGAELLSADGWASTDWTGDFASGFDHNTGNTTALTNTLAAVNGYYYKITYTVTGRTAGTFTIAFGGQTSDAISATGIWGPKATTTDALSITPLSTFDGTIVISIKQITGAYNPVHKILNSDGSTALEIRSTANALYNTFIGVDSGRRNIVGTRNTASGYSALSSNTTGSDNTASGFLALSSNTTGSRNTASGSFALSYNTTGSYNMASGYSALYSNTTGYRNTASGYVALSSNTTGFDNTASGYFSLSSNTTGSGNTASGAYALYVNTTGSYNTASGSYALSANTTGSYNTASGYVALYVNTTGSYNTASGSLALYANKTGSYNIASGYQAGRYTSAAAANETSNSSVYLGYDTRSYASGDTNEIVIGYAAVGLGSNTCVLGNADIITTQLRGNVLIGGATVETGSTVTLNIPNGTAPDAHVDNQIIIYSIDSSDSAATLGLYLEQAEEDIGTFTPTKKIKIKINGTEYRLALEPIT